MVYKAARTTGDEEEIKIEMLEDKDGQERKEKMAEKKQISRAF